MSRNTSILILILALCTPSVLQAQGEYALRPGDRVTINVFTAAGIERPELAGQKTIDRQGRIFLALAGMIQVSGLDAMAIRELLETRYKDVYPDAVISVEAELRVSVTGAVGAPSIYYVDPTTTIMEAMATAGGIGPELAINSNILPSDPSQVRLARDGQIEILDLRSTMLTPEILGRRVQSGDYFYVPPQGRSRVRDEITFWGSVVGFVTSVLLLAGVIGGN